MTIMIKCQYLLCIIQYCNFLCLLNSDPMFYLFYVLFHVSCPGTPKHIDYTELKEDLEDVSGVRKAHSLHIWSLTVNKTALAAHLVTGKIGGIFDDLSMTV